MKRWGVEDHRLPAFVVEGARTEHLVVLGDVRGRGTLIVECGREAHPLDWRLFDSGDAPGRIDPYEIEQCRQDIDGVDILVASATLRTDSRRPVEDQRVGHSPFMGVTLEAFEGRVPGPRPAPRIVIVGLRGPEIVDPSQILRPGSRG